MRKIIFLLFTILAAWQVKAADKVRFVAEAADVVVSGDQVRLVFTVNSQDIKDFRAPSIKGFDVLMGPSRSQQSSIQIINGKRTSNSSTAFTYILLAGSPGTYTIPAASVEVNGEKVFSNAISIKVLPQDQTSGNSGNNGGGSASSSRSQAAGSRISANDLFITATASKTTVHEQEAILLTYKVYTVQFSVEFLLYDSMDSMTSTSTDPFFGKSSNIPAIVSFMSGASVLLIVMPIAFSGPPSFSAKDSETIVPPTLPRISLQSPARILRLNMSKKEVSAQTKLPSASISLLSEVMYLRLPNTPVILVAVSTPGTYCLNPGATQAVGLSLRSVLESED